MQQCPLCHARTKNKILSHQQRDFYRCVDCDLIFVPACFHLSQEDEKKIYDYHQNDPDDYGYQSFLNRIADPVLGYLKPGMQGLDFGAGPGPALHRIFEKYGYPMALYDPIYANNPEKLGQQYDFVTCTEVVEHFYHPRSAWKQLTGLVKRHGYLAIMTQLHDTAQDFSKWWYKNDLTHVAFYSTHTLLWIASHFNLRLVYSDANRVLLFQA